MNDPPDADMQDFAGAMPEPMHMSGPQSGSQTSRPQGEAQALAALVAILRDNELDALTVRRGGATYELVAGHLAGPADDVGAQGEHAFLAASVAAARTPVAGNVASGASPPLAPPNVKKITAPLIGVFYRASAPGVEPFVDVGRRVAVGQPLCILEAMKLMNEITSDYAGTVIRVLPENGALVSLGEEMFWIEP